MKACYPTIAALILAGTLPTLSAADGKPGAKAEVLVKAGQSWNGQPYEHYPDGQPELTVLRLTIPAHTALPWHTHPMPNVAYILSGHLTVQDRASGQKRVIKAGEAFNEQVGTEHRGSTDNEPCTVVVTYAGAQGLPTSIPAAGEKHEY